MDKFLAAQANEKAEDKIDTNLPKDNDLDSIGSPMKSGAINRLSDDEAQINSARLDKKLNTEPVMGDDGQRVLNPDEEF